MPPCPDSLQTLSRPFPTAHLVIRADASSVIGSGHVMRCATLAQRWRQRGATVQFICRSAPGDLIGWLHAHNFDVYTLPDTLDSVDEEIPVVAAWLAEMAQAPDWLIVDHYSLDARWESAMRPYVQRILVIDDLANRPHCGDLLLDQNLHPQAEQRYTEHLPDNTQQLLGPAYALLRPEFHQHRIAQATTDQDTTSPRRLLVFFGGGDPTHETEKALTALAQIDPNPWQVDVVVGASNPRRAELEAQSRLLPQVRVHVQTADMATLMAHADLFLGAGGTTTWERCCLGLPSLVVTVADNQLALTQAVAEAGAIQWLGNAQDVTVEMLVDALTHSLTHPERLRPMREQARQLVDGLGVERVLQAMQNHTLHLTLVTDAHSWINSLLTPLIQHWEQTGHLVRWVHQTDAIQPGDLAFFLSFSKIVSPEILARHAHNLVVHASALPQGKGWSPMTWQILEGQKTIPLTLFEAAPDVDSGCIYQQTMLTLTGTELVDEWRELQTLATRDICTQFVTHYPDSLNNAHPQTGDSTYYPRRRPADSKLNPNQTLREQFNLLRVVDNEHYPAYFELEGETYILHISKAKPPAPPSP